MNFLFVFAGSLIGFLVGIFYGVATVPKGSGLAGPAIMLLDGVIGAVLCLLLALWGVKKLRPEMRKKITIALLLLSLIPLGWVIYRIKTLKSVDDTQQQETRPVTPVSFPLQSASSSLGLGMLKPDFFNKKVLYFYSPNLEKSPDDHTPFDSLSFAQSDHHQYDITYAPPWFYPSVMKMDYEMLYLKVLNKTHDWVQVEVNKQTGQSTWIDGSDAEIIYWPEFLLKVNSIENTNPSKNPLKVRPLLNASPWNGTPFEFMLPIMINENWIKVSLRDNNMKEVGTAWLLWHDGKSLLIGYNLLS